MRSGIFRKEGLEQQEVVKVLPKMVATDKIRENRGWQELGWWLGEFGETYNIILAAGEKAVKSGTYLEQLNKQVQVIDINLHISILQTKASGIGEVILESLNNEVGAQYTQSTVPNPHDMEAISASFGLKKDDMHDNVHETENFLLRKISQILKDR